MLFALYVNQTNLNVKLSTTQRGAKLEISQKSVPPLRIVTDMWRQSDAKKRLLNV